MSFAAASVLAGSVSVTSQAQQAVGDSPAQLVQAQYTSRYVPLSASDASSLRSALEAARSGNRGRFDAAFSSISDPIARKIARWAFADAAGEWLSFFELDQARRDFADWPRGQRRQELAESRLETSGMTPEQVIQWFGGQQPVTAKGAMALAAAYTSSNRTTEAQNLVRDFWRTKVFEADEQRQLLSRFGSYLTQGDHEVRANLLLYGPQGPAARDIVSMLSGAARTIADARIAIRSSSTNADSIVGNLPPSVQSDPGLMYERISQLRRQGRDGAALALIDRFPPAPGYPDADSRLWLERRNLINAALRNRDYQAAYGAATGHGLTSPGDMTDAEFYAGWLALSKLNRPAEADAHFTRIQETGRSPITQGRALYWRGRAHEAMGNDAAAQAFYAEGGKHVTTFYGQLAAEKAGITTINLGRDPVITEFDRARFEGRETVQALRALDAAGETNLFRAFVQHIDDSLPSAAEYALLVDLAQSQVSQELAMVVVRAAAQKGFVLPERGYPVITVPQVRTSAEPAFVYGIIRQESGFDPKVRSSADARGMMQLLPSTAQGVARRMGTSYSVAQLYEGDYNMRLGAFHLGELVDRFNGSYLMAAAGYNAGPGRPAEWINFCGDPRSAGVDPLDFIECIPFSETRNYVMRVLEGMQVYRARLNDGVTRPTLAADLKRGGYSFASGN